MTGKIPLSHEAYRFLAAQAGLDTANPHLDELYPYVQSVLSSVRPLDEIDVDGAEPDLVFNPLPEAN